MATQFASLTPTVQFPRFSPTRDFKVATLAGPSQQAAINAVPVADAGKTLDLLALKDKVDALIATARDLLSPPMYAAFLEWGEKASHFATRWEENEDGDARCIAAGDAIELLAAAPATTIHDLLVKAYVEQIVVTDSFDFGPIESRKSDSTVGIFAEGFSIDLPRLSPINSLLWEIAEVAAGSREGVYGYDHAVGHVITSAFSYARGANSVTPATDPSNAFYAALSEYRRLKAVSDAMPVGTENEDDAVNAYCAAMDRVLAIPAPNLGAFAEKLSLLSDRYASELDGAPAIMSALSEAQTLARGGNGGDPHAEWLAARNSLLADLNAPGHLSNDELDAGSAELNKLDTLIEQTPPTGQDGVMAQLVLLAQVVAEGHEPDELTAARTVRDAANICGIGSLAGASQETIEKLA